MRKGANPAKDVKIEDGQAYHRIIIPVYIPELEGYFEKGLEFTRLCLESVIKTRHEQSRLTVINNGCCEEVSNYIRQLQDKGDIDQVVHHSTNMGKIDPVIAVARTCEEELITISDGDVLFKDGWIQGVEEVFVNFPEAGMVSPVPHGTTFHNYTVNTLFDGFFKRKLRFQSICDPDDMLRFAKSIGALDTMYKKELRLKYQLTVQRNECSAVVGCGHFVSTLRREVFDWAPKSRSRLAYATEADKMYIDVPNEKAKLWRLATPTNYAYHMGNYPEDWMYDEFESLKGNISKTVEIPKSRILNINYGFKKFVVNRLWFNKIVRPYFFKFLGLKEGARDY